MIKDLAIVDIRTDGGTLQRPIDDEVLKRYMALIKEGVEFPPVDIVNDGKNNWLWDGAHRWHAYRKLGKKYIPANIEDGTKREAVWFSFHANHDHGYPRQPGTVKDMLLEKIFTDKEWSECTDEELANWIGVTWQYVCKIRNEYEKPDKASPKPQLSCGSGQGESSKGLQAKNEGSAENDAEKTSDKPKKLKDSSGAEVPKHLVDVFSRGNEIKQDIRQLNLMLRKIREGQARNDPLYAYITLESLEAEVGNVKRILKATIPYAVCKYCRGDAKDCRACDGLGFANEMRWRTTAKELK